MKYIDRIYGEFEITEPVVLEIIQSPEIQRLKGVDQVGFFEPHFPGTRHYRFEHSLGVYLLLKKYDAPIEEQIAGLIHDVSHLVFSHVADYYFSTGSQEKQSHQDNSFEDYVKNSSLPKILEKYNFDLEYILDDKNFLLKENNIPDICSDRIDYSLREAVIYKIGNREDVKYFLKNLKVENKQWIFSDFENAQKFAEYFKILNEKHYCGIPSAVMFKTTGEYMKYAFDKKYILPNDLNKTDDEVLEKISKHLKEDEKLQKLFDRMNNKVKYKNDPNDFEERIVCKSRVIDPLCHHDGKVMRVSEINLDWKTIIEEEMKPKEYFLKFLE
ncbi:MAG: HD domain-containing protein [Candidatus Moraniibacteriota bacterium]